MSALRGLGFNSLLNLHLGLQLLYLEVDTKIRHHVSDYDTAQADYFIKHLMKYIEFETIYLFFI